MLLFLVCGNTLIISIRNHPCLGCVHLPFHLVLFMHYHSSISITLLFSIGHVKSMGLKLLAKQTLYIETSSNSIPSSLTSSHAWVFSPICGIKVKGLHWIHVLGIWVWLGCKWHLLVREYLNTFYYCDYLKPTNAPFYDLSRYDAWQLQSSSLSILCIITYLVLL